MKLSTLMRASRVLLLASIGILFTAPARGDSLDCPSPGNAEALAQWQDAAAALLDAGSISDKDLSERLRSCFGATPPACMSRLASYASRDDIAIAARDGTIDTLAQKDLPEEFHGERLGAYTIPARIEEIAAERGWLSVRYKSRHAGGFDPETPSLLMIYVPGSSFEPPLRYDRWINIALPADTGTDALNPTPQAAVPDAGDYARETARGPSFPRTLTLVALERSPAPGVAAQIFFQKFRRIGQGQTQFVPEANSSASACYACHPNGLRPISPLGYHVRAGERQMNEASWEAVRRMNQTMEEAAGRAPVSWRLVRTDEAENQLKALLKPEAQWPLLGPTRPLNPDSRSQAFILGGRAPSGTNYTACFRSRRTVSVRDIFNRPPGRANVYSLSSNPQIRWEKVSAAMRCAACHNNQLRGGLNAKIGRDQIDFKILVDQSMPLGWHQNPLDQGGAGEEVLDQLSGDERIALANCLYEEFELEKKRLKEWLTQKSCSESEGQ